MCICCAFLVELASYTILSIFLVNLFLFIRKVIVFREVGSKLKEKRVVSKENSSSIISNDVDVAGNRLEICTSVSTLLIKS